MHPIASSLALGATQKQMSLRNKPTQHSRNPSNSSEPVRQRSHDLPMAATTNEPETIELKPAASSLIPLTMSGVAKTQLPPMHQPTAQPLEQNSFVASYRRRFKLN